MKTTAKVKFLLGLSLLTALAAAAFFKPPGSTATTQENTAGHSSSDLQIHFLDVGQSLSVFLESDGHYMLYDGGNKENSRYVVAYLKKQGTETLDYIIASHYDSDHISGLIGALNVFKTNIVIGPDYKHDTKTYESFLRAAGKQEIPITHPAAGTELDFGNAKITILAPVRISEHSNNNSVAVKIEHGNNSFIITGDAEHEEEADILNSGIDLDCNVLVLGHHGSANATTWKFLQQTVPEYAVISCGSGNPYGHPHAETMEKLEAMGIGIFRTDTQGTIIAVSNGAEITWNVEPAADYSGGGCGEGIVEKAEVPEKTAAAYVLNQNTEKIHLPSCASVKKINAANYAESDKTISELEAQGYTRCGNCLK